MKEKKCCICKHLASYFVNNKWYCGKCNPLKVGTEIETSSESNYRYLRMKENSSDYTPKGDRGRYS